MSVISLRAPKLITEESVLALLTEDIPMMSRAEIDRYDFDVKDILKKKYEKGHLTRDEHESVLIKKIIAAIGYEKRKEEFGEDVLGDAAFSYEKATKEAFSLEYNCVAFRCALRAVLLRNELLENKYSQDGETDLEYSRRKIFEAERKLFRKPIKNIFGDDQDWFPNSGR